MLESPKNQTPVADPAAPATADPCVASGRDGIAPVPHVLAKPFTFRRAAILFALGTLLTLAIIPLDGPIARAAMHLQEGGRFALGGDVRRTLLFLQQFGDLASSLVIGIAALLLDPRARARILDWIVAGVATSIAVWCLKVAFGRPRPRVIYHTDALDGFNAPWWFGGSLRAYPLVRDADPATPGLQVAHVPLHSWDLAGGISSDLWSFPSSHSSAAAVLAAVLIRLYPPLWPLVTALLAIVMASRVIFGAHFPADVVAGATVGLCVGLLAMDQRWGTRLAKGPIA